MDPWKIISRKTLIQSDWFSVDEEVCELPNGKRISDFYTVWQPDWVLILAKNFQGKWLTVKQYRHGTKSTCMEFPAGIIEPSETPLEAAKRELQEECAYGGGKWTLFRELPVNPDRHRGRFFVVIAENVEQIGATHFDETEWMETKLLTTEEILSLIGEGEICHPHQMASFLMYHMLTEHAFK